MALYQVAEELQHELTKVDNVGATYIVGGSRDQIRVEPDPEHLAALRRDAEPADRQAYRMPIAPSSPAPSATAGASLPVVAGQTLQGVPDIGLLLADDARRTAGLCQGCRRCASSAPPKPSIAPGR